MTSPLALVVEDDSSIRALTEIALTRLAGWRVITAERGRTAIELAREHRPSVILMDLMMPEMDGVEAARILLGDAATADIPVVLLTARPTFGDEDPPWAGVAIRGVIAKPFDPMSLARQVADLVGWSEDSIADG
ncbi:response regulator [Aeromicrobium sp. YIM 150415]|uniref:Response regulator n=1 Tax=Aeromicrobium piscarium TaxID=2590901 RepID=A0A554RTU2_9ACTN|nr:MULTISPECIES: response regulator [Aeromicrobium]MBM9465158.1 response regulator [Aeromicrobium sp. YIM 150415]TSD57499.1 response regulator [Aeromicrobium piscarium]